MQVTRKAPHRNKPVNASGETRSTEFIEFIQLLNSMNSEAYSDAEVSNASHVLANYCIRMAGAQLVGFMKEIEAAALVDHRLARAFDLVARDAIDFNRADDGLLSLKLLPVLVNSRAPRSQIPLSLGANELKTSASLCGNLLNKHQKNNGWVLALPQLIHQSSLNEVDLVALILIKEATRGFVRGSKTGGILPLPLKSRGVGLSEDENNLYFLPFVQFDAANNTGPNLAEFAADWEKTSRLVDNWVEESGHAPATAKAAGMFRHCKNPIKASQIIIS